MKSLLHFNVLLGRITALARGTLLLEAKQYGLLICLSVTTVSPAKVAKPITIPLWTLTLVGPRNDVLDGVQILMQRGNVEGDDVGIFPHAIKHRSQWPMISPQAVDQHSNWPAAQAVDCHTKCSQ